MCTCTKYVPCAPLYSGRTHVYSYSGLDSNSEYTIIRARVLIMSSITRNTLVCRQSCQNIVVAITPHEAILCTRMYGAPMGTKDAVDRSTYVSLHLRTPYSVVAVAAILVAAGLGGASRAFPCRALYAGRGWRWEGGNYCLRACRNNDNNTSQATIPCAPRPPCCGCRGRKGPVLALSNSATVDAPATTYGVRVRVRTPYAQLRVARVQARVRSTGSIITESY